MPEDVNLLPFNKALELYDKMREAYYNGDEKTLAALREEYPTLFEPDTANLLRTTAELLKRMQKQKRPQKFTIH